MRSLRTTPQGSGLHWPKLDADLTIEGLLAGLFGSRSWMRTHAAKAGSVKSGAKAQAAKANGAKGGRPRETIPLQAQAPMDVRKILQTTLSAESGLTPGLSFAQRINQRFNGLGGEALAVPERQDARPSPSFDAS